VVAFNESIDGHPQREIDYDVKLLCSGQCFKCLPMEMGPIRVEECYSSPVAIHELARNVLNPFVRLSLIDLYVETGKRDLEAFKIRLRAIP